MKDKTMDAICSAEDYFTCVLEKEAHNKHVPSRTEELYYAVKGLKGICIIKHACLIKDKIMEDKISHHDLSTLLSR